MIGKFIVARSSDGSVNCGYLRAMAGTTIELSESRVIWRWRGANSMHELSLYGASTEEFTRISEPVEECIKTEVREIIPCTKKAEKNLKQSRWLD